MCCAILYRLFCMLSMKIAIKALLIFIATREKNRLGFIRQSHKTSHKFQFVSIALLCSLRPFFSPTNSLYASLHFYEGADEAGAKTAMRRSKLLTLKPAMCVLYWKLTHSTKKHNNVNRNKHGEWKAWNTNCGNCWLVFDFTILNAWHPIPKVERNDLNKIQFYFR